jgi:hypothetical protein
MEKDNVKQFPKLATEETMEPRELTPEEIEYIKKKDEEELDGYLNKFKTLALPDSSKVEVDDEDEEEETITLDFTEEGIKAYEKVGEGVAVRDADGNVSLIDDQKLAETIQGLINDRKPTLHQKYQDMITDRFVSRAIANLIEQYNKAMVNVPESVTDYIKGDVGYEISDKLFEDIRKKKNELQAAIVGGKVHYDRIPKWAESHIDEYISGGLTELINLVERD